MAGLTSLWSLEGRWLLSRVIRHADGREHRLDGTSVFTRSGPRLIQNEEGLLDLGDGRAPLRATRRFVWRREGGRLEVLFDDMRPFHTVPLGVARPETTYLCPPDRYAVSYDFTSRSQWQSVWKVEGPGKRYVMESTCVSPERAG